MERKRQTDSLCVCMRACVCVCAHPHTHACIFHQRGPGDKGRASRQRQCQEAGGLCCRTKRGRGAGGGEGGFWAWQMNRWWTQPFNFLYGYMSRYCTAIWHFSTRLVAISILLFSHFVKDGQTASSALLPLLQGKRTKTSRKNDRTMSAGLSVERARNPIIY